MLITARASSEEEPTRVNTSREHRMNIAQTFARVFFSRWAVMGGLSPAPLPLVPLYYISQAYLGWPDQRCVSKHFAFSPTSSYLSLLDNEKQPSFWLPHPALQVCLWCPPKSLCKCPTFSKISSVRLHTTPELKTPQKILVFLQNGVFNVFWG